MNAAILNQNIVTLIVPAGNYPFVHIRNVSPNTVWLSYDGMAATLTTVNGWMLFGDAAAKGEILMLNNDGVKPIFTKNIYALAIAAGTSELRIAGID